MEDLFKLYYSDDVQFDPIDRQIVTGIFQLRASDGDGRVVRSSHRIF